MQTEPASSKPIHLSLAPNLSNRMPIVIKDYTWEETESTIFITVPLKGVKTQKVDVFSTEEYIKVAFYFYYRHTHRSLHCLASLDTVRDTIDILKLHYTILKRGIPPLKLIGR